MAEEIANRVDPKIVDTVSVNNVKTIGEVSAHSAALSMQNAVTNQQRQQDNATASAQRFNEIANQASGVLLKRIAELDIVESAATVKAGQTDVPSLLAVLNGVSASIQQAMKGANLTPPTTP